MARNELMAKYMMENSNFDETIKDYNVTIEFMTENLQRGTHEPQNTHTVVTSDFQKLEFPYTMNERHSHHSDEDGISDGVELGNEKWINVTEFVKKTYEDAIRSGQPHKATFEDQVEDIIEKNGAYTDFNGNKVYGSVKWNDDKTKVLYRVYDYKSNPKLNDTDFDGLNDNIDNKPLNNYHNVKMDIEENRRLSMTHGSEYRHFAGTPNKYNSELAQMSLVFSNIANGGREIDIDQDLNGNINITQYMQTVGFMPLTQVNLFNNRGKAYIGLKELQYYNNKKYIYGVFVGGFTDKTSFQELLFDTTGYAMSFHGWEGDSTYNVLNRKTRLKPSEVKYIIENGLKDPIKLSLWDAPLFDRVEKDAEVLQFDITLSDETGYDGATLYFSKKTWANDNSKPADADIVKMYKDNETAELESITLEKGKKVTVKIKDLKKDDLLYFSLVPESGKKAKIDKFERCYYNYR